MSNSAIICKKCGHILDISLGDDPWSEKHLICPECDSTYTIRFILEDDKSEDIHADP
jgi:Predicted ATPase involved in replication control, Cdc46/Mcm family